MLICFLDEAVDSSDNITPSSNLRSIEWCTQKDHSLDILRDGMDAISFCGSIATVDYLSEDEAAETMTNYDDRSINL